MNEEMFAKILEGQGKISANIDDLKTRVETQGGMLLKQNETLIRNTITVEEHHKRSLYLEQQQDSLIKRIDVLEDGVEAKQAVKHFVRDSVKWVGYVGIAVSSLGGVLTVIYQVFKKLGF